MKLSTNTALKGLAIAAFLSAGSLLLHAQVQPKVVLPPTVEGDWVRTDEVGVSTYHNLDASYGEADLTQEGKKLYDSFGRPQSANSFADNSRYVGKISVVHPDPCVFNGGFGGLEYNSAGFHAVKTKNEFVLMTDGASTGRHVYLDGRALPSATTRTPSANGYAVATIEPNGTLVVKATDFTLGRVSGDGVRGPSTVLTQRFEPSPDGKKLKIVYTWEDSKYYNKPHTYFMTFERMAPDTTTGDNFCDATDTTEAIT
jgi:hypothetical protein